jgi:uncharacterized protein
MKLTKIGLVENYVRKISTHNDPAHGYEHVDRVRKWAVEVAESINYQNLEIVEMVALLHDVGLSKTKSWAKHASVGAKMAAGFLRKNKLTSVQNIKLIEHTILAHSEPGTTDNILLIVLRDADMLDMLGSMGIARTVISQHNSRQLYDPNRVKGYLWNSSYKHAYKRYNTESGAGNSVVDQINFQMHCLREMNTVFAKNIAKKLIAFMKSYIIQLDNEVNHKLI